MLDASNSLMVRGYQARKATSAATTSQNSGPWPTSSGPLSRRHKPIDSGRPGPLVEPLLEPGRDAVRHQPDDDQGGEQQRHQAKESAEQEAYGRPNQRQEEAGAQRPGDHVGGATHDHRNERRGDELLPHVGGNRGGRRQKRTAEAGEAGAEAESEHV